MIILKWIFQHKKISRKKIMDIDSITINVKPLLDKDGNEIKISSYSAEAIDLWV